MKDTDESDVADVVWYVPLHPRAVVSGALLAYMLWKSASGSQPCPGVSDCEEREAELPATHCLPYRWAYSDRMYPRPMVYMRIVVLDELR